MEKNTGLKGSNGKLFGCYMLVVLGLLFISVLIHEGVHTLQAQGPQQLCIGIKGNQIASVTARDFDKNTEYYAYGISTAIAGLLFVGIVYPVFFKL